MAEASSDAMCVLLSAALVTATASSRSQGQFGSRTLKPGHYRLTAIAIDAAGNRSTPAQVTITVR